MFTKGAVVKKSFGNFNFCGSRTQHILLCISEKNCEKNVAAYIFK